MFITGEETFIFSSLIVSLTEARTIFLKVCFEHWFWIILYDGLSDDASNDQ